MNDDLQQLKLLAIFHYVLGGLSVLFSSLFLIHLSLGLMMLISPESMTGDNGEPPPAFAGYLFAIMGGVFFLLGMVISIAMIVSGWALAKQKKYMFSFIMACIECVFMPLGTILGVFTIIVLSRESVKQLYGKNPSTVQQQPSHV